MDIAYFCPKCLKSHNYLLDFHDVVYIADEVHVKAHAEDCGPKHWVWKVFTRKEYEHLCKVMALLPGLEVM